MVEHPPGDGQDGDALAICRVRRSSGVGIRARTDSSMRVTSTPSAGTTWNSLSSRQIRQSAAHQLKSAGYAGAIARLTSRDSPAPCPGVR